MSPQFFERLVVELLLAMGYGGSLKDVGKAIGQTGDGGIDGIIKEDKLGLDVIYIQAKRWDGVVGRPEIHKFVCALAGKRANKRSFYYYVLLYQGCCRVRGVALRSPPLTWGLLWQSCSNTTRQA
jgi:restriction endonuclease Mrr